MEANVLYHKCTGPFVQHLERDDSISPRHKGFCGLNAPFWPEFSHPDWLEITECIYKLSTRGTVHKLLRILRTSSGSCPAEARSTQLLSSCFEYSCGTHVVRPLLLLARPAIRSASALCLVLPATDLQTCDLPVRPHQPRAARLTLTTAMSNISCECEFTGALKKGSHVVIKGCPCKIVDYSTSKTGKHGHAKANIVAVDIFTGKKLEDISPTSHNMMSPIVTRKDFQLIDVDEEGFVTIMDERHETRSDLVLDVESNEIHKKVKADFDEEKDLLVTVLSAMGTEKSLR
eukprot:IDg8312t1